MPLIYVTGISGSGKSAVLEELRSRGYEAYGVDEDHFGQWLNRRSGEEEIFPHMHGERDVHRWYREHEWALDTEKIAQLSERSDRDNSLVFLCGVAAGDGKTWKSFSRVCALVVDEETIRKRIGARTDDFGKAPEELTQILEWNAGYEARYRQFGATIIDATEPLTVVVDRIVSALSG